MRWTATYSIRSILCLVTGFAFVVSMWFSPRSFDIRYDTSGGRCRIAPTQVGNPVMIFAVDANEYTKIVKNAPVLDVILNDDYIDTVRIRVNGWQKLALSRYRDKIWLDIKVASGRRVYRIQ